MMIIIIIIIINRNINKIIDNENNINSNNKQ